MPLTGFGRHARPWGARVALCALLAASVALQRRATAGDAAADVAGGYVLCAGLALWAWHLCDRGGVRLGALVGRPPSDRRAWGWAGLALPLLAFELAALTSVLYALSWAAPGFVERDLLGPDEPSLLRGRPLLLALDAAVVVVLGPVAEELFFRGALLARWSARWGARRALLASAALFAALHADPVGAFVFAVCMALLFRKTGTLLVPMACHVLHNAVITAVETFTPDDLSGATLAEFRADARWAVLALPVAAAVLALSARRLRGPDRAGPGAAWRAA